MQGLLVLVVLHLRVNGRGRGNRLRFCVLPIWTVCERIVSRLPTRSLIAFAFLPPMLFAVTRFVGVVTVSVRAGRFGDGADLHSVRFVILSGKRRQFLIRILDLFERRRVDVLAARAPIHVIIAFVVFAFGGKVVDRVEAAQVVRELVVVFAVRADPQLLQIRQVLDIKDVLEELEELIVSVAARRCVGKLDEQTNGLEHFAEDELHFLHVVIMHDVLQRSVHHSEAVARRQCVVHSQQETRLSFLRVLDERQLYDVVYFVEVLRVEDIVAVAVAVVVVVVVVDGIAEIVVVAGMRHIAVVGRLFLNVVGLAFLFLVAVIRQICVGSRCREKSKVFLQK
mmetsp:Transcript_61095/g.97193  ORF Transcript_61095/g.97193 Transcript_61095/m.97193 type:complete len:339 (+) Transcript_61095:375-1391(+)